MGFKDFMNSLDERNDEAARRTAEKRAAKEAERAERTAAAKESAEAFIRAQGAVNRDTLGLDFAGYTDEELAERTSQSIDDLAGRLLDRGGFFKREGLYRAGDMPADKFSAECLGAILEQNWILMQQNEAILRELRRRGE